MKMKMKKKKQYISHAQLKKIVQYNKKKKNNRNRRSN